MQKMITIVNNRLLFVTVILSVRAGALNGFLIA